VSEKLAPCRDCGVETLDVEWDGHSEWYMVKKPLWNEAGMESGFLCIGCLETRIGRTLVTTDFTDVPVNDLSIHDTQRYAWSYRTQRLIDRLTAKERNKVGALSLPHH
jgi:hypothetical protein